MRVKGQPTLGKDDLQVNRGLYPGSSGRSQLAAVTPCTAMHNQQICANCLT